MCVLKKSLNIVVHYDSRDNTKYLVLQMCLVFKQLTLSAAHMFIFLPVNIVFIPFDAMFNKTKLYKNAVIFQFHKESRNMWCPVAL